MNKGKIWSNNDIELLIRLWDTNYSLETIANKLNRSVYAIKVKACRLKLGPRIKYPEYISLYELLSILGMEKSYTHQKNKFIKFNAPLKKKNIKDRKVLCLKINDFWEWAYNNKLILNFSKFEKNSLGREPEWVDEKRKSDRLNPSKKNINRKWSTYEDNLLIAKVKSYKYTYKDLSEEFNRTESAIKTRIDYLGIKERPLMLDNTIKWTNEELEEAYRLHVEGYDNYYIANKLNKSHLTINGILRNYINNKNTINRGTWNKEEEQFILKNSDKSTKYLAKCLKRSYYSVCKKRKRLENQCS